MFNRRRYLATLIAGSAMLSKNSLLAAPSKQNSRIHIFTKPTQSLSFDETASWLEKWNVGGVEATIRKGGWFEPEDASEKLPAMMEALQRVDRASVILASDVNNVDHPDVKRVLEPASKLGVRYMRMAYYKYDFSKKVLPQLEAFAKQAQQLAQVCHELKLTALYQNHAGAGYVGGPLWDLMEVIDGIDPKDMSLALDIRHATIESAEAWRAGYARVRENIGAIYAKDAVYAGSKIDDGPLGRSVKGKQLFDMINKDHPDVPISLHMEYFDHRPVDLLPKRLEAIAADVAVLQSWL
jgi:sugar phosphate isomerase/epimerase